ncbi:hypothetical protein [Sphingomonas flavescens]|jgi:hypothetical protein|uniref:phage fiber-tail adaptor protein n=1 Tax=Sphingomonas flavescens TaxID=3132797 RepID=UPI00280643DE|nr:hypothetical protein [Sphingomonas limnosediminicola]
MTLLLKDPAAALDYAIDWGADYLGEGDALSDSSWSVEPDEPGGVIIAGSNIGGSLSSVQASGGIAGRVYRLSNRVVTLAGRTDERSIVLRVEKR